VSQRQMLERQQQQMRDMEEPLSALEGSVNNLQQAGAVLPCRPDRRTSEVRTFAATDGVLRATFLHAERDPVFFLSQNEKNPGERKRSVFFERDFCFKEGTRNQPLESLVDAGTQPRFFSSPILSVHGHELRGGGGQGWVFQMLHFDGCHQPVD
ncbi:unnamed protein product, partial [Effrenium voratum]